MDKVSVTANVYFPDNRRRDLDNITKLLCDAIVESGIIEDDNWQILNELHLYGFLDREDPRIELEIKEISGNSKVYYKPHTMEYLVIGGEG